MPRPKTPEPRRAGWDILVLTASDEGQAAQYRRQIEERRARGVLDPGLRCLVVPDPGGVRVGSGGAAINALRAFADEVGSAQAFDRLRILMIHSGGDSRRVPQYSACGKLFSPVPRLLPDGGCAALLDELLRGTDTLPARLSPGMLTLAGDILLYLDAPDPRTVNESALAFSVKAPLNKGVNHGVFVTDAHGTVASYLHKATQTELTAAGAVDAGGMVPIDTGAVWFNADLVRALYMLGSAGLTAPLSFYADFVYPLASRSTLDAYLLEQPEGAFSPALERDRCKVWEALSGYGMQVVDTPSTEFIHFGTTAELLDLMNRGPALYATHGWTRTAEHYTACNSEVDALSRIGRGSYIENSTLIDCDIGRDCVISGLNARGVCVPDNTTVHALPQKDGGIVVRVYGTRDNPKDAVLFGRPLDEAMTALYGQDKGPKKTTLWDAPLYLHALDTRESLAHALALRNGTARVPEGVALVSLESSFRNADTSVPLPV